MGFINLNEKTNNRSELFPKGTYEMQIVSVHGDASPSGHENMQFDFLVRKDLDKVSALANTNAKTHGRHFFANVWTAKDKETGQDSGSYYPADLANIADAIGLTQVQIDKYIKSKEDLMKACEGKFIRIYISVGENTYKGETRKQNSAFTNSWQKTKFPPQAAKKQETVEDPFKGNTGSTDELSENDIPF